MSGSFPSRIDFEVLPLFSGIQQKQLYMDCDCPIFLKYLLFYMENLEFWSKTLEFDKKIEYSGTSLKRTLA